MTHAKPLDMSNTTKITSNMDRSMRAMDRALLDLHDRLAARNAPNAAAVRVLPDDAKRAYYTGKRAENRAKAREAADEGRPKAHAGTIRDALADAALMILATGGPGADQVRHVLGQVFSARPGVPLKVERQARTGRLRPKLVGGR